MNNDLKEFWTVPLDDLFLKLNTTENGLSDKESHLRLKGNNQKLTTLQWLQDLRLLISQFKSPLMLILIFAVVLSLFLGDFTNSIIVLTIITLSGMMGFWQERNANLAINKLKSMVQVKATVLRSGIAKDVPLAEIVPGDIVLLNAGDIIPGDGRLLICNDLHINEAALTGESFPVEKSNSEASPSPASNIKSNSVFQGTSVINGTGSALIIATGSDTMFGEIASALKNHQPETAFEKDTRKFGYLLLQVTLGFSLLILILNMFLGRPVVDSVLFALALAIGITPELLPAIVTISLSTGAKRMAKKKVVVKKLSAIQNLGSINVFCTDKTGTLSEGVVKVHSGVDMNGAENERILQYAFWNAKFETGFTNPLDEAIRSLDFKTDTITKVDEVPYDFTRKRLSVVVNNGGQHLMITKGAVKNVLNVCSHVQATERDVEPIEKFRGSIIKKYEEYGQQGFRTIGISYKDVTSDPIITKDDETDLIFLGLILLYDPPKLKIAESLKKLHASGISIKLITGDNLHVATYLAKQVGLSGNDFLIGSDLRSMSEQQLVEKVKSTVVFAETEPDQKDRIVKVLQKVGYTVGYLGDGINDASAMKTADVSISVDTAVDIARETADIVLLEKDLDVLYEGVQEGRRTFLNTLKYIFITTSANFGNMFSVAGASLMLPFLPLLPKQILLINFLTDIPAMTLSSDSVDEENLKIPQQWNNKLIRNFMMVFGFQSAIFDFLTFLLLFHFFKADTIQFRTGWYLECVLTELLILMIVRTRRPFFQSNPGKYLLYVTLGVGLLSCLFIYPPFARWFEFVALPYELVFGIASIVGLYGITAEFTKRIFFRYHLPQY